MSDLTPEELGSLREMSKGLLAGAIPAAHADKLIKLRLIMRVRMEYKLSEAGMDALKSKPATKG